ncbi:MAG: hypothetical protein HZB43_12565 [candidate division Zixibacteria bacterium]|nr:hypothetical protein [candidate division Zixibacteria bacterium]
MSVRELALIRILGRAATVLIFTIITNVLLTQPVTAAWVGVGPQNKVIEAVAVAPDNALVRFAGAFGWGIFKSTNGGVTWSAMPNTGMTNAYIRAVLALSSTDVFVGTNDGVYHSVDGGSSWTFVLPTLFSVRSLAYDPLSVRLYAGTYGDDLYYSTTGGGVGTWTKSIVLDDTSAVVMHHIRSVAVYGRDSVYVGGSIADVASGGALFVSRNGGVGWSQVQRGKGIRGSVVGIAISPNNPDSSLIIGIVKLGVYKSTDGGISWLGIDGPSTVHPIGDTNISCVAFTPAYRMAAGDSTGGFYRRALGDTTLGWWPATGVPLMPAFPTSAWSNAAGMELMLGTDGKGVYRSTDSGATFAVSNSGMMGTAVRQILIASAGRIVVATGFGDKIWYTDNGGTTWAQAAVPTSNSIDDLAATSVPGTLYAGSYAAGVLKSTDNGQTWVNTDTTVINRFVRAVAVAPGSATVAYAGTANGVFKTINGGASWVSTNGVYIPPSTAVHSLAVSPFASNTVLAGTDSSYLYRTIDGGATWSHVATAAGFHANDIFIRTVDFDPATSGRVYAGCDSGHVYISSDNGATWTYLATLATVNSVRQIRIDPAHPSHLFAATFGGGVFASQDGGATWANISGALPDSQLYTLTLDPAGPSTNVYLGTRGHGLYKGPYTFPIAGCSCPSQGDLNGDTSIDVFDVIAVIGVAFSGNPDIQDPQCPISRGDVNNDVSTDVFDVIYLIATAFSGGASPINPCGP